MPLTTTVIGSYPKPEYLKVPNWFETGTAAHSGDATTAYTSFLREQSDDELVKLEEDMMRATADVIKEQSCCGIDVVSDGEVRRENYIHYLCRFIEGIDFNQLTESSCRNGAYTATLPTVRGPVSWRGPLSCADEWRKAQSCSKTAVKYTLPGPMTIIGTLNNAFYAEEEELAKDLAQIIGHHARELAAAGCAHIQVDEPLFARRPDAAIRYGIPLLDTCFEGVDKSVQRSVHICCGYPGYLDQQDYHKADPSAYFKLAPHLDACSLVDAVSIEDAHRHNDLTLLKCFKQTTVILGSVKIASSHVETVEEIEERLNEALKYIDAERLIVAPDCGLAFLPSDILTQKLSNMCTAARRCHCEKRTRLSTDSTAASSFISSCEESMSSS